MKRRRLQPPAPHLPMPLRRASLRPMFAPLFLALCALLSACGEAGDGAEGLAPEKAAGQAAEAYNGSEARSVVFTFSLAEEESGERLLFLQGTANCVGGASSALSGRVTAIENGSASTTPFYYRDGVCYLDRGAEKYCEKADAAQVFRFFFCSALPLPPEDCLGAVRSSETDAGTKYVCGTEDCGGALTLLGERIYRHCGLKKPRRDRTECKSAEYAYVVGRDGALRSFRVSLALLLCDTAPYYPNYSTPEEDLRHGFKAELEIRVKTLGAGVEAERPDASEYTFPG